MSRGAVAALAIGGSAGSLAAICRLLEAPEADSALAIVVCLHTGERDTHGLCAVLGRHCRLPVREAQAGARVAPGTVHVAPGGYHLLVERSQGFALCAGARVQHARPSIDVLFESMAEAYQTQLAGVLLSGANADGAAGLARIHQLGGMALVQCPYTAALAEMPAAALALFTPDRVADVDALGHTVRGLSGAAR